MTMIRQNISERFWNKVRKIPGINSCWIWTGSTDSDGYGRMTNTPGSETKTIGAHQVGFELQNGPIPKGMKVLHSCDNPPCVRGKHLFLGTQKDNAADRDAKGRNGSTKLSRSSILKIRAMYEPGQISFRKLGKAFGISASHAFRIVHRLKRRTY